MPWFWPIGKREAGLGMFPVAARRGRTIGEEQQSPGPKAGLEVVTPCASGRDSCIPARLDQSGRTGTGQVPLDPVMKKRVYACGKHRNR